MTAIVQTAVATERLMALPIEASVPTFTREYKGLRASGIALSISHLLSLITVWQNYMLEAARREQEQKKIMSNSSLSQAELIQEKYNQESWMRMLEGSKELIGFAVMGAVMAKNHFDSEEPQAQIDAIRQSQSEASGFLDALKTVEHQVIEGVRAEEITHRITEIMEAQYGHAVTQLDTALISIMEDAEIEKAMLNNKQLSHNLNTAQFNINSDLRQAQDMTNQLGQAGTSILGAVISLSVASAFREKGTIEANELRLRTVSDMSQMGVQEMTKRKDETSSQIQRVFDTFAQMERTNDAR